MTLPQIPFNIAYMLYKIERALKKILHKQVIISHMFVSYAIEIEFIEFFNASFSITDMQSSPHLSVVVAW